ncbi:MAG: hypothetical protein RL748_1285 [Pseudomonadota bacterium]
MRLPFVVVFRFIFYTFAPTMTPTQLAQEQLDAYNAHDLSRFLAVYSETVTVYRLSGSTPVLQGKADFAKAYAERFKLTALHAEVVQRMAFGDKVIDHERVTGLGDEVVEVAALYQVAAGLIQTVWFLPAQG